MRFRYVVLMAGILPLTIHVQHADAGTSATPGAETNGFEPAVVIDSAWAIGPIVRSPNGPTELLTVQIRDIPSRDTIPSRSRLEFRWRAAAVLGSYITRVRYLFNESVEVDTSVHAASIDLGAPGVPIRTGNRTFSVEVTDNRGYVTVAHRRFFVGEPPETWVAGPNLALLDARFGWSGGPRVLNVADWTAMPDLSGTPLSCDSLTIRPAERPVHRTFFEIYEDRLYVHAENDTVHLNSWVIFHGGGSDLDSPYQPLVGAYDPALLDTMECASASAPLVVRPAGLVGSPIGLRHDAFYKLDGDPPASLQPAWSNMFPNFDPSLFVHYPTTSAYVPMIWSAKAYFALRAVDSENVEDYSLVSNLHLVADHVDGGIGTPREIALRPKVMTFFVNKAPFLLANDPAFVPRPLQAFSTRTLELNLLADDVDPYQQRPALTLPGGPSNLKVLRWNVVLHGRDANGDSISFAPLSTPVMTPAITVGVPATFADSIVALEIEICDCQYCETDRGSGRCASYRIPIQIPSDSTTAVLASVIAADATTERVSLRWHLTGGDSPRVERWAVASSWQDVGEAFTSGRDEVAYEDRDIVGGQRYGYRLVVQAEGSEERAGETWVEVPRPFELALEGVRPNPSFTGELSVRFSLPSGEPARLELFDASGRRWLVRDLRALGAGRHTTELGRSVRIPAGLYLLRLTQGKISRIVRAAVLK